MPRPLIRFAAGCIAGCSFVIALLALDVGGLGTLVLHDRATFLALVMLLTQLGGLFGMAVMITAIAEADDRGRRVPARVPVSAPSRAAPRLRSPNR